MARLDKSPKGLQCIFMLNIIYFVFAFTIQYNLAFPPSFPSYFIVSVGAASAATILHAYQTQSPLPNIDEDRRAPPGYGSD
ncbi:hypothetical protein N7478_010266 [Penicillium angulare]|uniref:uncharacterized protein n=1 Tax=Penicillium angulare TaxID=116970 RepID=UPI0025406305|nr:uncharacterized protein N7478_010266 [Penicillium angulare]KAJ5267458.1 hypothetical protein N7478_010266 [Penicillium angulare]